MFMGTFMNNKRCNCDWKWKTRECIVGSRRIFPRNVVAYSWIINGMLHSWYINLKLINLFSWVISIQPVWFQLQWNELLINRHSTTRFYNRNWTKFLLKSNWTKPKYFDSISFVTELPNWIISYMKKVILIF